MENQPLSKSLVGRSSLFIGGLLVIVALLAVAIWWLFRPSFIALYKDANDVSQAEILATLSQRQVPYRINAKEGVIEVPTENAATARMYLAEAGIPTRSNVGFELFDRADYGMSEFSQKINYQRALEGELARSVMSIAEVEYARVHLTFKKNSLYQQAEEPPKASVIVRLRSDAALSPQRVRGIQQLLASAIEGMTQERVVVLNDNGQVLSVADGITAAPEHIQLTEQVEQALQKKAEQLLLRPLGNHGAEVSVRVQMNFDRVKSVREQPLASEGSIRHEKRMTSSENSTGESTSKRSQDTREIDYENGNERAEIEQAAGKVERISVGVVLTSALANDEMKGVHNLLEAALGLDFKRGDRLVIAYIPSSPSAAKEKLTPASTAQLPAVSQAENALELPSEAVEKPAMDRVRWGVAILAALLSITLLLMWARRSTRRAPVAAVLPRLSSVEREQLLLDLQRWLADGR